MLAAVSSVVKGIPRDGASDEAKGTLVESNCTVHVCCGGGGGGWWRGV